MEKVLNIAIAGCGYWGPNLVRNFIASPHCRVKQVCDIKEDRTTYIKKLYPSVTTTTIFDDLLNDKEVDAIAISTPAHLHHDLGKKSLLAGKHTLIEKPMATSSADCEELISLAAEQNLTLMVGHTFIYSNAVRKIKEIMDSGDIGEVQYIYSRRLNLGLFQNDLNVAWDLASHDISIILYLIGEMPVSVNCQGKAHVNMNIEDVTNMSLCLKNGGFAIIHSSWLDPNKVREMAIVGSRKMIVYNDIKTLEKIKIFDKRVEVPPFYDTFAEFHYSYHYGDVYIPYLEQVEPLKAQTQHFLDCIRNGKIPETSGLDGLRVVQTLEAASHSLKNGGAKVEIKFDLEKAPLSL
jgi:predicted dehydrogenase